MKEDTQHQALVHSQSRLLYNTFVLCDIRSSSSPLQLIVTKFILFILVIISLGRGTMDPVRLDELNESL